MWRRSDLSAMSCRRWSRRPTRATPGGAPRRAAPPAAAPRAARPPARARAARRPDAPRQRAGLKKPERRLDQRGAVLPDVVDRIRDLGDGQIVRRREQRLKALLPRLRVEPVSFVLLPENHGHAIVDRRHDLAGFAGDDRAGVNRRAALTARLRPEPGERERLP